MTGKFDTIGIVAKRNDQGVSTTVVRLANFLRSRGRRILLDRDCPADIAGAQWVSREELGRQADLVVVVGGDGTLLDAGRVAAPHDTPVLGVNLGRLGFMVDVLPDDMTRTLDDVFAGDCIYEQRLLLAASIVRAHPAADTPPPVHALNEVVIRNRDFARVLEFDTYMDGRFISHHRADGIIVASPTGSTAYALSGGGPVLHPALSALALVPICPHTLSDRPLVIDAQHEVEVVVDPDQACEALFTADGQTNEALAGGDRVRIRRAAGSLTLVHPTSYDYYTILREKLHWGRGQRVYRRPPTPDP